MVGFIGHGTTGLCSTTQPPCAACRFKVKTANHEDDLSIIEREGGCGNSLSFDFKACMDCRRVEASNAVTSKVVIFIVHSKGPL